MIIETVFSTVDKAGTPNWAPMGVVWGEVEMSVRPFRDTDTYRNLVQTRFGVANVTDDVLVFARTALSDVALPCVPANHGPGVILKDACYWRELAVVAVDGDERRADVRCRVVAEGRQRDFLGFNRGKSAIIEAAIIATRLHLHDRADVESAFQRYRDLVRKTGGEQERKAMQHLEDYVTRWYLAREN